MNASTLPSSTSSCATKQKPMDASFLLFIFILLLLLHLFSLPAVTAECVQVKVCVSECVCVSVYTWVCISVCIWEGTSFKNRNVTHSLGYTHNHTLTFKYTSWTAHHSKSVIRLININSTVGNKLEVSYPPAPISLINSSFINTNFNQYTNSQFKENRCFSTHFYNKYLI